MADILEQAKTSLWTPQGLSDQNVIKIMDKMLGAHVNEGDLYFQCTESESYSLDDGIVKSGSFNLDQGVGVRITSGEKTGYAYTDDIQLSAIEQAADAARGIARHGESKQVRVASSLEVARYYQPVNPLTSLGAQEKITLLREIDSIARQTDPRVIQVMSHIAAEHDIVMVVCSDGQMKADIRPLVRINVSVIVEENGRRETGSMGGGARMGYDAYLKQASVTSLAKEAVRQALVNLEAKPAPAGTMPVVLGPGWPGVMLHEAVGHGLEGDFNRKGSSAFSGRVGERVANPLCTVVDDGTIMDRRGSLSIDDEGTPTQRTVLIEDGILKGYLQDKMNARLMKTAPTGNGRRESYACAPMPRMTNTFMLPGPHAPEEIIKNVEDGIYAVNFGGGQVDITSGKFVFTANEAYRIEKGKITYPVKGITLIGSGPDVMTKISMVGDDLKLDEGVGTCGKDGQSVPVGVGLPTVLIDELTVGGTGQ